MITYFPNLRYDRAGPPLATAFGGLPGGVLFLRIPTLDNQSFTLRFPHLADVRDDKQCLHLLMGGDPVHNGRFMVQHIGQKAAWYCVICVECPVSSQ
jgi:hypothetical protein